ncbi:MAG: VirB8/TrbF family protein [Gammaproteobacteria bacterium]
MSHPTDDFIRSSGNLAFVNTWLKLIVLVLFLTALLLGAVLAVKIVEGRTERVLPIVINQATGDALAVDFSVIDAAGEQRAPVEIRKFGEDFVRELFTYNRFTVRTNLESVVKWATPEALIQVKEAVNLAHRSELMTRNAQGVVEIRSFLITETQPVLKVQVYFQAKALSQSTEILEEGQFQTVLLIKPIKRSQRNPHGLIVLEYRQSQFKEGQ